MKTLPRAASRKVCIAGITTAPGSRWMEQMARNVTLADTGFRSGCRDLRHDRDAKFCAAFDGILGAAGIPNARAVRPGWSPRRQ